MGALVRRVRGAVGTSCLVLLLAACAEPSSQPAGDRAAGDPKRDQREPTPATTVEPADPDRTVDPPPPLDEPLQPADMLIYNRGPLSAEMIRQIRELDGIVATEQLSMSQVAVENRVIVVAAVDPATYRRFTPVASAQAEEVWARVAGGEMAIPPKLGRQLQQKGAFIKLGNDKDAARVHIGAYAEQVEQVDAVVNEKWGEELGMIEGNALLISTGINSPQSVRKPMERIVGDTASVQSLDAVARFGLDTRARQTAFLTGGSVADAVGSFNYRALGGGRIAPDQAWVNENIRTGVVPILGRITCHKAMLPQLEGALREVVERGLADEVYQTAGCYYPRFIAGSTQLSLHSFGIAIDINSLENGRGTVGQMDREVVDIFKRWGFAWGGDWGYTDPMHFEMNAIVEAR